MTTSQPRTGQFKVVIAGGGVAALEAALALRNLAGERVAITIIAPDREFVYRPMVVREPFSGPTARRYRLDRVARDFEIEVLRANVTSVDPGLRAVHTDEDQTVDYDALVIALGAKAKPRFEHSLNLDVRHLDDQLQGLVQDIEAGLVKRIAYVAAPGPAWPLPIYELALMTANRAYEMNVRLMTTIITPEPAPLAAFGTVVSDQVSQLLTRQRVVTLVSATCRVTSEGKVYVDPSGREISIDRIVAMPELFGPALQGVPADERAFIPIDHHAKVIGLDRVYAVGDAANFPIKQGGLAAQQADAAAEAIAALAGVALEPQPIRPMLNAIMIGGKRPLYLRADLSDRRTVNSEASSEPLSWPPRKIEAQYLGPYLHELDGAYDAVR